MWQPISASCGPLVAENSPLLAVQPKWPEPERPEPKKACSLRCQSPRGQSTKGVQPQTQSPGGQKPKRPEPERHSPRQAHCSQLRSSHTKAYVVQTWDAKSLPEHLPCLAPEGVRLKGGRYCQACCVATWAVLLASAYGQIFVPFWLFGAVEQRCVLTLGYNYIGHLYCQVGYPTIYYLQQQGPYIKLVYRVSLQLGY